MLDISRKFLNFAKEICYQEKLQHSYNAWGSTSEKQEKKREWAPYLAGFRGMGEVHSGGPLLEELVDQDNVDMWHHQTVICSLMTITLVHAFFDVRLSEELCTQKLCEKLQHYAQIACDAIAQRSRMYRAFGAENDQNGNKRIRPPLGAGFFDDDPHFFYGTDEATESPGDSFGGLGHVHTLTSVLCWAAADRLQRVAAHFFNDPILADQWKRRALEIHEDVCRNAWNPQRSAFTSYWGGDRGGPSLLRLAELGFISAEDPRFRTTVRAFEVDAGFCAVCLSGPDGEPLQEDASLLATTSACFTTNTMFWYCEALRSTGAPNEARRILEALLRSSKHRGVLAEAIDIRTSELWGNSPCASSLLSLLRVAPRLSRTWREV